MTFWRDSHFFLDSSLHELAHYEMIILPVDLVGKLRTRGVCEGGEKRFSGETGARSEHSRRDNFAETRTSANSLSVLETWIVFS